MDLDTLYKQYGQQTISFKILQTQLQQTEKAIVDAINAQNMPESAQIVESAPLQQEQ